MKSARIQSFTADPRDIRIEDVPVPEPGRGQVRVRMLLSPVNPSDLNFMRGAYHEALQRLVWNQGRTAADPRVYYDPDHRQLCAVPPYALGGEGVGIVDACGSGFLAGRLRGRRVALVSGPPHGTWQEYTLADAIRAFPLPDAIPDEQAAMFWINPITAYVMVRKVLDVPRGAWLIVTGAGSALGKSVVRMGRRDGFRTICVVRGAANTAALTALGADAVIETSRQDLVTEVARITGGRGAGYALDCVGGELATQVVQCLAIGGHYLNYGTLANSPLSFRGNELLIPGVHVAGFYLGTWAARQSMLTMLGVLRAVKRLMLDGVFETEIGATFPLDRVVQAVTASLEPGRTGKVQLRIGSR